MKSLYESLLLTLGVLALAETAYAQVPSTNDTSTTDGNFNTGSGTGALGGPTTSTTGTQNSAFGFQALLVNASGSYNTASGFQALYSSTTGSFNTASGVAALHSNTTGSFNTACGYGALYSNTTSNENTASGYGALFNSTGGHNTASGYSALLSNTTGGNNTASGVNALQSNTTGNFNVAEGSQAGNHLTTGGNNIAVGFQAGLNLTTGSNNIDIGNVGVAGESNLIRIGTKGTHKAAVIAGISTTQVTGSAVYVTNTGRLGVLASSERYKIAIASMGSNTAKLGQLRAVTFHLKTDPKGALQYGLIAEEVAKVYPELVIRGDKGRIEGVRYDELAPMLLNEVQQQATEIRELKDQQKQLATQAEVRELKQQLQAALLKLQTQAELLVQR